MTRRRKAILWLASTCCLSLAAFDGALRFSWRERPDPVTGVSLELRPASQSIKAGEEPAIVATLVNRAEREVLLVQPGDGSRRGRRTPVITWSTDVWFSRFIPGCGNINALSSDEVFVLKPGKSKALNEWILLPRFGKPGTYHLAVRYSNEPDRPWRGIPLSPHDPLAKRQVQDSTRICTVSNWIEVSVED